MQEISLLLYEKPIFITEKIKYAVKIGSIIFAIVETCIDIALALSMISYFTNKSKTRLFQCYRSDYKIFG